MASDYDAEAEARRFFGAQSRRDAHGCDVPKWPPGPHDVRAWRAVPDEAKPGICRVAHGVPPGLDKRRLRSLGNAVVPQVAEIIGHAVRAEFF